MWTCRSRCQHLAHSWTYMLMFLCADRSGRVCTASSRAAKRTNEQRSKNYLVMYSDVRRHFVFVEHLQGIDSAGWPITHCGLPSPASSTMCPEFVSQKLSNNSLVATARLLDRGGFLLLAEAAVNHCPPRESILQARGKAEILIPDSIYGCCSADPSVQG